VRTTCCAISKRSDRGALRFAWWLMGCSGTAARDREKSPLLLRASERQPAQSLAQAVGQTAGWFGNRWWYWLHLAVCSRQRDAESGARKRSDPSADQLQSKRQLERPQRQIKQLKRL